MKPKSVKELHGIAAIGVVIGKATFHLVGFGDIGQRVLRKKIRRLAVKATFAELPHCIVGMVSSPQVGFPQLRSGVPIHQPGVADIPPPAKPRTQHEPTRDQPQ